MVFPVTDDVVMQPHQGADDPQIALKSGGKGHHCFLVQEFPQLCLQLQVHFQGPVEEPGTGAAGSVPLQGVNARLHDLGVRGQAQIVVGAQHNPALALHLHHRVLPGLQGMEVGINPQLLGLVHPGTPLTFFKYIHKYLLVHAHIYEHRISVSIIGGMRQIVNGQPAKSQQSHPIGSKINTFLKKQIPPEAAYPLLLGENCVSVTWKTRNRCMVQIL